ncbi:unnamed protein product, partial [Lymnaea stagnalis]
DKLISDDFFFYYTRVFIFSLNPTVLAFGLVSNVINIAVFARMGLNESVTLSLFLLSLSDVCFTLLSSLKVSLAFVAKFPEIAPKSVDLLDLVFIIFWYSMVIYDTSTMIRVYIAVARACCVAIPLTFKHIFTKLITVYAVCAIFVAVLASRMPMLVSHVLCSVPDTMTNVTRFVLFFTATRPTALVVNDIVNKNIFTWGAISLVLISLFVLKIKLVSSAKFRHMARSEPQGPKSRHENKDAVLVGKDLQVLKVVILVSAIFIACTLPATMAAVVRRLEPEFNTGGRLESVFQV